MDPESSSGALPKLKRPREIQIPTFDASSAINNLQKALTTKQRLLAVHHIRQLIDAGDDPVEAANWLVHAGLFRVMHLQLRYVIQRHGSVKQEVQELANLLAVIVQDAGPEVLRAELEDEVDGEDPNLAEVISRLFQWELQPQMICLLKNFSAQVAGTKMILRSKPALHRLIDVLNSCETSSHVLLEALDIIKNLSFNADEYKQVLLDISDLVLSLTTLPGGKDKVSAIWRNFSMSMVARRRLAHDSRILNSLLSFSRENSNYILRNLLNTLISMSMESDSSLLLVCHGDGLFIDAVKLLLHYSDPLVRKRSARVLKLWASNDLSGPILIHDQSLMDLLSNQAMKDQDAHARQEAGEAFCRCSQLIQSPMPQHKAVLDALQHLARNSSLPVEVMARALRAQASHQENRVPMAERTLLLVLLAHVATTNASNIAKEDACCALADLSLESGNLERLSINPVFEAIVRNSVESRGQCQDFAILCIVRLALFKQTNRIRFSTRADLLQALLQYAASSLQTETKSQVKQAILMLVSEL